MRAFLFYLYLYSQHCLTKFHKLLERNGYWHRDDLGVSLKIHKYWNNDTTQNLRHRATTSTSVKGEAFCKSASKITTLAIFEINDNISLIEPPSLKKSFVIGLERENELITLPVTKQQKSRLALKVRFDLLPQADTRQKLMWWDSNIDKQARLDAMAYKDNGKGFLSYISKFHEALHLCSSIGHLEDVPMLSNFPVCGLEQCMFPGLIHARLRVVSKVLRAQIKLSLNKIPKQQALLLGVVSKNLTRPSRRVAQLLGIGDARVAAEAQWMIDA
jgi:hypothetical protein